MSKAKKTTIRPLGDMLVVKPDEALTQTDGGIVLPDLAVDKSTTGIVRAVGPGKLLESGKRAPLGVEVGDKIMFGRYSGTDIKVDEEELVILRATEILSVLDEHEDN